MLSKDSVVPTRGITAGYIWIESIFLFLTILTRLNNPSFEQNEPSSALLIKSCLPWMNYMGSIAAILLSIWMYQTSWNARKLGAENMKFSPIQAAIWWQIPLLNLIVPYVVLNDLCKANSNLQKKDKAHSAALPALACIMRLACFLLIFFSSREFYSLIEKPYSGEKITCLIYIGLLCNVIADVSVFAIIRRISSIQNSLSSPEEKNNCEVRLPDKLPEKTTGNMP